MEFPQLLSALFLIFGLSQTVFSGRIMILTAYGTKSTTLMLDFLAEQLAMKGHEVVHITKDELKSKSIENLSYIYLDPNITYDDDFYMKDLLKNPEAMSFPWINLAYADYILHACEPLYNEKYDLRKKFDDSGKFDVILMDYYGQECLYPLVHTKNAALILTHANAIDPTIADALSVPTPHFAHNFFTMPVEELTMYTRTLLAAVHFTVISIHEWLVYPRIENIARKYIPNIPPITDILKKTSIILASDDVLFMDPRPSMPFVVDITCLSCRPAKPLPPELEQIIQDSGDDGFIIFAMGTMLKAKAMPQDFLNAFLLAFAKLKQTIVWKFEQKIENLPKNVKRFDWLPNQDLLGHPKCRLFIYHGGMYSSYEAIYHGVPMVGLGAFGDQRANIQRGVQKGITVALDKSNLTVNSIYEAINTALKPSYKNKIKEMSVIMRDQSTSPLERAFYWIDYVIQHNGAEHLHSDRNLSFVKYFSLDLFGIALIIIGTLPPVFYYSVKILLIPIVKYILFHIPV